MSAQHPAGGYAFPTAIQEAGGTGIVLGMTLRQYAAITLKVPDSGAEWLDAMIRASVRDDLARQIIPSLFEICPPDHVGPNSYAYADDMLKAREAQP